MTEKAKSDKKKTNSSENRLHNRLTLIFLLVIVGILAITSFKPEFVGLDKNQDKKSEQTQDRDVAKEEELPPSASVVVVEEKDQLPENIADKDYTLGPEPPLFKFSPQEEDFVERSDDPKSLSPYELELKIKNDVEKKQSELLREKEYFLNRLNLYRAFTAQACKLIIKFFAEEDFSEELKAFESIEHPNEINNILESFAKYNQLLINRKENNSEKSILLFDSKLAAKIIKVTKNLDKDDELITLRESILKKIPIFHGYVYSYELQTAFFKD
jgi:hypothetical protein